MIALMLLMLLILSLHWDNFDLFFPYIGYFSSLLGNILCEFCLLEC